jgi:hypothetical protein
MDTTLEERFALYERTLQAALSGEKISEYYSVSYTDNGLCYAMDRINTTFFHLPADPYQMSVDFPEVWKFAPDHIKQNERSYWYPCGEWEPRIEILQKAIAYTKELIHEKELF